jgi:hypothetical protein
VSLGPTLVMTARSGIESSPPTATFYRMNKAAALTGRDAQHKAQAESHLAEAQRVLKELAAERRRHERRNAPRPNLVAEVKAILQGA